MGKRAKQAKRDARNQQAGVTTAQRPSGQQSQDASAAVKRDTPQPQTPLPVVKRLPAKPVKPAKPRPGEPAYRGPRDPVTGEAIGTVGAHHFMRAALYDATRAVLDRQLIPAVIHSSQMETAGTGENGRRAQDLRYAGGAPRFSGDFQRYMRYVQPRVIRETTQQRRRWFDNVYVCDALRRNPRVGSAAVIGLTAILRDGHTWQEAAALVEQEPTWLWRKLQVVERLLHHYYTRQRPSQSA